MLGCFCWRIGVILVSIFVVSSLSVWLGFIRLRSWLGLRLKISSIWFSMFWCCVVM